MNFDKSNHLFPVKDRYVFLSHCAVSAMYGPAADKEAEVAGAQRDIGGLVFSQCDKFLEHLRESAARLLQTSPDNIAFVKNTSEGICMVANGYPFKTGDEIVSYVNEYPANHYPWRLQEKRGTRLVLLPDRDITAGECKGKPCAWSMDDLLRLVTPRTRVIAISHVQFASGFAADLPALGIFCKEHGIDLVVDAAQSLGCMPLRPDEWNISAIAASGWKWLLGPIGTGILYTSPEFRDKLEHTMAGADMMRQGSDYLDHSWQPFTTARRFEYSTSPISLAAALHVCMDQLAGRYGIQSIWDEVLRLQQVILDNLDRDRYSPLLFPSANRSGILSVSPRKDPDLIVSALQEKGIVCTARGGYLRLAPHFYNTEEELLKAVEALNEL